MANNGLDPKRITPEQLATLAKLLYATRPSPPDAEIALSEALDLICKTFEILKTDLLHWSKDLNAQDRKELVESLRLYMDTTGKGASEIAKELGVNRATVTLWRSGKGWPGKKASIKLANLLANHQNNPASTPDAAK